MPKGMAQRVRFGTGQITEQIDDVTVVFAELKGLAEYTQATSDTESVTTLKRLIAAFDEAAARNGVERIKTVGDTYLAVTGLSQPLLDHMRRTVEFALSARTIVADTEIGGAELHPGDPVVPLLAAANRDPDEFDAPETLDLGRTVNRHLSFGVGHHLCIGSGLARLEAVIALRRLFERVPTLTLAVGQEPEYRPNLQLRGFSRLPVSKVSE